MRAYLIGHLDKFVGGLTHPRNNRPNTINTAMQRGETARNRTDFCRCFKTGAAVFLHDDGIVAHSIYRNTLRAAWMLAPNEPRQDMFRDGRHFAKVPQPEMKVSRPKRQSSNVC